MTKKIYAALTLCALVTGMAPVSNTRVQSAPNRSNPQRAEKVRPFKASGIATIDWNADLTYGAFEVIGNATHLGAINFTGSVTLLSASASGVLTYHVHGAYVAANGDTIEIDCPDWESQLDALGNVLTSTGVVNIVGGTGRFAHASGSYVGNLYPGESIAFTADGSISY